MERAIMMDYQDTSLAQFEHYATISSAELASLGHGLMIDYETGYSFIVGDEETALFLASARAIVLELIRRIQRLESSQ
jgi:hypothetical protein